MKPVRLALPMAVVGLLFACGTTKKTSYQKEKAVTAAVVKTDTGKVAAPLAYEKVITSKAITQRGLFTVHNVNDKWYFEIPDSLLDRDILIVNRISKGATEGQSAGYRIGWGGDQIGENIVQFSKGPSNRVFIKGVSFLERSYDSSENGMYRALENSNFKRILAGFDIKAFTPDSSCIVIDLTDYINGDNNVLFFTEQLKTMLNLGAYQKEKSFINTVRSFPLNVEIKTVKTYGTDNITSNTFNVPGFSKSWAKSFELNSSIVLLPKHTMRPRYVDRRVGYFWDRYRDFDMVQGVYGLGFVKRWRLQPKPEDEENYRLGRLVEPQKPIVFYIDPATPQKWVPYLMQGVNDWQKAFEKAGFKNAISAKEVDKNDTTWSMEDARHNVIVYKASLISNASGPSIHDPRTGEILETHINWYHNVMALLHDWYMVQASPLDCRARKWNFDDSLMGKLIRFVCAHEVGHTLGLAHNFGASSSIPVDSLRSKNYVEANGFCPSIMDYARFNYVAQPEDNISESGIMPRIGVYDEWAINWGYRWLPQFATAKEEDVYLKSWVTETIRKDKRLWFGDQSATWDPRCRPEDLGDNPIKAGAYGIKNLKRVMRHSVEWTYQPGESYWSLSRLRQAIFDQYTRYLVNVATMIGGQYTTWKISGEPGKVIEFVPAAQQKEAFNFINKQLFEVPSWLENEQIYSLTGEGKYSIESSQEGALKALLSNERLIRMNTFSDSIYSAEDFLRDCKDAIWKELKTYKAISKDRRTLQRLHIMTLKNSFSSDFKEWSAMTDVAMLIKWQLRECLNDINKVLPGYKDKMSIIHLKDMRELLRQMLDPKGVGVGSPGAANDKAIQFDFLREGLHSHADEKGSGVERCDMWRGNF